jgi:hypothetical protein
MHHFSRGYCPTIHRSRNPRTNRIIGGAQRIGREMSVTSRRRRMLVAEQGADDRQAQAAGGPHTGEAVPQIVQPNVGERGRLPHPGPYLVDRRPCASAPHGRDYLPSARHTWKLMKQSARQAR